MSNLPAWPTPPSAPSPIPGTGPDPTVPLQERRGTVDRVQQMHPRVYRVPGFLNVIGVGSSVQDVNFPVKFVELPAFTSGWSLEDGQALQKGNYPRIDVGVATWHYEEHAMHVRYYVGATLAIVALGRADQRAIVHWQCEGKCLGNLASTSGLSVEQTL